MAKFFSQTMVVATSQTHGHHHISICSQLVGARNIHIPSFPCGLRHFTIPHFNNYILIPSPKKMPAVWRPLKLLANKMALEHLLKPSKDGSPFIFLREPIPSDGKYNEKSTGLRLSSSRWQPEDCSWYMESYWERLFSRYKKQDLEPCCNDKDGITPWNPWRTGRIGKNINDILFIRASALCLFDQGSGSVNAAVNAATWHEHFLLLHTQVIIHQFDNWVVSRDTVVIMTRKK